MPRHLSYNRKLFALIRLLLLGFFGLLVLAYLILIILVLTGNEDVPDWEHLPAILGIPLAIAIAGLVVYVIYGLVTDVAAYDLPAKDNWDNAFNSETNNRTSVFALILLWILCFLAIIFSIYLLLPGSYQDSRKGKKGKVDITFLQINDIYEISPLDHGRSSGLARIATIRKELMRQNKNTYMLIAGDFLSPSAIGTLHDSSAKSDIAGMQMVEGLNAAGLDLAIFGNHEFDVKQDQLQKAINRSGFDWVNSNVMYSDSLGGGPFSKDGNDIPVIKTVKFDNGDGAAVVVGFIGLTIKTPGGKRFEKYADDYYRAAEKAIAHLSGKCDFLVAITHLDLEMDKELAQRFPQLKLIIGGHEHINSYDRVGNTIIAKADANVRTAYIHSLSYDTRSKNLSINSRLLAINNAIEEDPGTKKVVSEWNKKAHDLLVSRGFEPCKIVDSLQEPLDGTEAGIRTKQTNLGEMVCKSLMASLRKKPDCVIFNSGSIRIDDMLTGYITQYDLFRVLPYKGQITMLSLPGWLIDSLVKNNIRNKKDGSFLQVYGITKNDSGHYYIGKQPLAGSKTRFEVVTQSYVSTGRQPRLQFLGDKEYERPVTANEFVKNNDVQAAFINYFENNPTNKAAVAAALPGNNIVPCY